MSLLISRCALQGTNKKYESWKLLIDRGLAVALLVPGLPLMLVLLLLVRVTSSGPGLFRQVRVGKQGRAFTLYKIRSMRMDAEPPGSGPVWAQCNDPRSTLVGGWLRDSHLDELPQLINVLKGEMSLVGPRPERPEFVVVLSKSIPEYQSRLDAMPGITGLAQINLPADTDLESVRNKLYLDRLYIAQRSLWLDLRLLVCTGLTLFGLPKKMALNVLQVARNVPRNGEVAIGMSQPNSSLVWTPVSSGCESLATQSASAFTNTEQREPLFPGK